MLHWIHDFCTDLYWAKSARLGFQSAEEVDSFCKAHMPLARAKMHVMYLCGT